MNEPSVVFSSSKLPSHAGGKLLELPRQKIGWEWMSFYVTRLQPGEVMRRRTEKEESAFVLLGGSCVADWGDGKRTIGKRQNVFAGLPYTLYLPANSEVSFTAETACEFAECSVPSNAQLEPRLITPGDVVTSLRGGGNVSRQIVDASSTSRINRDLEEKVAIHRTQERNFFRAFELMEKVNRAAKLFVFW